MVYLMYKLRGGHLMSKIKKITKYELSGISSNKIGMLHLLGGAI